jgi:hypothetical protein
MIHSPGRHVKRRCSLLEAEVGLAGLRIGQELASGARQRHPRGFEDEPATRQCLRVLGVLLDEEHGDAGAVQGRLRLPS